MLGYAFSKIRNRKQYSKNFLALSIIVFLISVIVLVFGLVIGADANVNMLLGEAGNGGYYVTFMQYIFVILSFLMIIATKYMKKKGL